MPLEAAETADFGKPRIVIDAHFEIRVADAGAVPIELVREAKHTCVAGALERREIEITVFGDRRDAACGDRAQVAHQPAEAHEIALVQRHQADEAAGPGPPRRLTPLVRDHGPTIPRVRAMSGAQASLYSHAVENSAGNFLDRDFRRIEERNSVTLVQRFRGTHLECDLTRRGIAAVRPALVADLLQAVGLDGEAEQLAWMQIETRSEE